MEEVQDGLELHNFKGPNAVERTFHREWSLDDFDMAGEATNEQSDDLGIEILEDRQHEDPMLRSDSLVFDI